MVCAQRQVEQLPRLLAHACLVGFERGQGVLVDHRPDIGGVIERIADLELARGPDQHAQNLVGHILLQEQHAQRRAALAGAVESGSERIVDHLLRQRRGIDDHGVEAAGLGDQLDDRAVAGGERAVDGDAGVGAAGEHHAVDPRVFHQRRAHRLALARQEMQHIGRHAGLMQQPDRPRRDQRRLLGGLGHHRVAGRQRAGDLAGENGERKVPRRDRREHAAAMQAERVLFPGRSSEQARGSEFQARLSGGIAEMIHRLAQIGLGIGERLARFPHHQRHQRGPVGLEQIRGAVEHGGPCLASQPVERIGRRFGGGKRSVDGFRAGAPAHADHHPSVMRRGDPSHLAPLFDLFAGDDGVGRRRFRQRGRHRAKQRLARRAIP